MGRHKEKQETRMIPVDYIFEPEFMIRDENENSDDLRLLGYSMKEFGQINPISVIQRDEKYILIAGHRRLKAAALVGLERLEAKVFDVDEEGALFVRWEENAQRLQNNPAEEARFIAEMLGKLEITQVELSKKLGKSSSYVSQRLALLNGPPEILEAIRVGAISFEVARELLLFPTPELAIHYLAHAMEGGASGKVVRRWRDDAHLMVQQASDESEVPPGAMKVSFDASRQVVFCEACRNTYTLAEVTYVRTCRQCEAIIKANPGGHR